MSGLTKNKTRKSEYMSTWDGSTTCKRVCKRSLTKESFFRLFCFLCDKYHHRVEWKDKRFFYSYLTQKNVHQCYTVNYTMKLQLFLCKAVRLRLLSNFLCAFSHFFDDDFLQIYVKDGRCLKTALSKIFMCRPHQTRHTTQPHCTGTRSYTK